MHIGSEFAIGDVIWGQTKMPVATKLHKRLPGASQAGLEGTEQKVEFVAL